MVQGARMIYGHLLVFAVAVMASLPSVTYLQKSLSSQAPEWAWTQLRSVWLPPVCGHGNPDGYEAAQLPGSVPRGSRF